MKDLEEASKALDSYKDPKELIRVAELLLNEASNRLVAVPPLLHKVFGDASKEQTMGIGRVLMELKSIHDHVYERWPDLQPQIVKDYEANYDGYTLLLAELDGAYAAESENNIEEARRLFSIIRDKAQAPTIRLQAEAGLFRCGNQTAR